MDLGSMGQDLWNEAYRRRGNFVFYPNEDLVRFINRYVRKRTGISDFMDIMPLEASEWRNFKSLDMGCGIGRHIKLLDEFGLNPYGIDLSSDAIAEGRKWMGLLNKQELADRMLVASVTDLPYEDDFFHLCILYGVLDCMPRDTAGKGLEEAFRVLKKNGLMYLDLYMDDTKGDMDEMALAGFDKGTVKSYYTVQSIKDLVGDKGSICEFQIIRTTDADGNAIEYRNRAHVIVRKNV